MFKITQQKMKWLAVAFVTATLFSCNSDSSDNNDTDKPEPTNPVAEKNKNWFTLAVLPDTQKYARYSPERFYAQTKWIAENHEKENIKFTAHLGDVVDIPDDIAEWDVARIAMGYLEKSQETPYSVLAGNHDVMDSGKYDDSRNNANEMYLTYFGANEQAAKFDTYQGANVNGFNTYHIFEADGQKFLIFSLDWRFTYWNPAWGPTNTNMTLEWVKRILAEHPDLPAIITTHQSLNIDEDGETAIFTDNGRRLWNYVIRDNDQVFLVLNGHHHGEAVMETKNKFGHKVVMLVVNYQSAYWGGNGMMQLIKFNKTEKKLDFRSYSPYVDAKPVSDRVDGEEVSRWEFSIPMDFEKRFANFNPKNGDGSDKLSEPGNIEGTRAHWILDKGHAVGEKIENIYDASGNVNTLTLSKTGTVDGDIKDFINFTDDKPPFGFANGSLRLNGSKAGGYYLTTGADNVTTDSTEAGKNGYLENYTVEAIFKLPKDWTPERASWSGILNNIGSITTACNYHGLGCSGGDASTGLAISSLSELQWMSTSANGRGSDSFSWDLNRDQWYHVVITNDGHQAVMYVNGAKVMRTGESEQQGLVIRKGDDWRIGVSSWNGNDADPFYGDIAEVRIVNRVINRNEWLYYQEQ